MAAELADRVRYPHFYRLPSNECHEPLKHKTTSLAYSNVFDKSTVDKMAKSLLSIGFPLVEATFAATPANESTAKLLKREGQETQLEARHFLSLLAK